MLRSEETLLPPIHLLLSLSLTFNPQYHRLQPLPLLTRHRDQRAIAQTLYCHMSRLESLDVS